MIIGSLVHQVDHLRWKTCPGIEMHCHLTIAAADVHEAVTLAVSLLAVSMAIVEETVTIQPC